LGRSADLVADRGQDLRRLERRSVHSFVVECIAGRICGAANDGQGSCSTCAVGARNVSLPFGSSHQTANASASHLIADTYPSADEVSLGPFASEWLHLAAALHKVVHPIEASIVSRRLRIEPLQQTKVGVGGVVIAAGSDGRASVRRDRGLAPYSAKRFIALCAWRIPSARDGRG